MTAGGNRADDAVRPAIALAACELMIVLQGGFAIQKRFAF